MHPARSFLVIPAPKADDYVGNVASRLKPGEWPDAIIFDLEDSVPPRHKSEARSKLEKSLPLYVERLARRTRVLVKINAADTEEFQQDLELVRHVAGPEIGVATAKTESARDLEQVSESVSGRAEPVWLFPAIETLAGYDHRDEILACAARLHVRQCAFGAGDMATSLGIERDYTSDLLRMVFCQLALSARRVEVGIIDSPSRVLPNTRDADYLERTVRAECEWGRRNGAAGKLAIHPQQVAVINDVFDTESRIARAREIIAQFERAGETHSLVSDATGEYIGTPTLRLARELVRGSRKS